MADRTLAVFTLEPAFEAAVGLGEVALASVDQFQLLRDDLETIRKTGKPTFVEMLKIDEPFNTING